MVFYFHNKFYPPTTLEQQQQEMTSTVQKPEVKPRKRRSYKKKIKPASSISLQSASSSDIPSEEHRKFLESLGLTVLV